MGLFDRFAPYIQAHDSIKSDGNDPFGVRMDRVLSPTEAIVKGRRTLLAGTNNYLGLTFDPSCIAAARSAL
ncbi:MAG: 8-amino-7-oxononanoate synthase, partial [Pseudomonadota bacterium]